MNDHEQLVHQLTELDEADFVTVLEQARRWRVAHRPPLPERPTVFDRDQVAAWYAQRHLRSDPYLREVAYLPENAPPGEIRLLDVDAYSTYPDDMPLIVLDFEADDEVPGKHTLRVAGVSPKQWECIQAGTLALPSGWGLAGHRVFNRTRPG